MSVLEAREHYIKNLQGLIKIAHRIIKAYKRAGVNAEYWEYKIMRDRWALWRELHTQ